MHWLTWRIVTFQTWNCLEEINIHILSHYHSKGKVSEIFHFSLQIYPPVLCLETSVRCICRSPNLWLLVRLGQGGVRGNKQGHQREKSEDSLQFPT